MEYKGKHYTGRQLAEMAGIKYWKFRDKRDRGWSVEDIVRGFEDVNMSISKAKKNPKGDGSFKLFAKCDARVNSK